MPRGASQPGSSGGTSAAPVSSGSWRGVQSWPVRLLLPAPPEVDHARRPTAASRSTTTRQLGRRARDQVQRPARRRARGASSAGAIVTHGDRPGRPHASSSPAGSDRDHRRVCALGAPARPTGLRPPRPSKLTARVQPGRSRSRPPGASISATATVQVDRARFQRPARRREVGAASDHRSRPAPRSRAAQRAARGRVRGAGSPGARRSARSGTHRFAAAERSAQPAHARGDRDVQSAGVIAASAVIQFGPSAERLRRRPRVLGGGRARARPSAPRNTRPGRRCTRVRRPLRRASRRSADLTSTGAPLGRRANSARLVRLPARILSNARDLPSDVLVIEHNAKRPSIVLNRPACVHLGPKPFGIAADGPADLHYTAVATVHFIGRASLGVPFPSGRELDANTICRHVVITRPALRVYLAPLYCELFRGLEPHILKAGLPQSIPTFPSFESTLVGFVGGLWLPPCQRLLDVSVWNIGGSKYPPDLVIGEPASCEQQPRCIDRTCGPLTEATSGSRSHQLSVPQRKPEASETGLRQRVVARSPVVALPRVAERIEHRTPHKRIECRIIELPSDASELTIDLRL
jgi:hypothetical protein